MLLNVFSERFLTKLRMDPRLEFIKESDGIRFCSDACRTVMQSCREYALQLALQDSMLFALCLNPLSGLSECSNKICFLNDCVRIFGNPAAPMDIFGNDHFHYVIYNWW
jgi:hypothetical protein